jgi:hypothetical protein
VQGLVAALLFAAAMQSDQTPHAPSFNRTYYELAASTGGDFYFWAAGEFASAKLKVPLHHEDVLLSYGDIDSERVFEIPVESDAKALTLFAGIDTKNLIVLVRPDGTVVRAGLQTFQHMLIATIPSPPAGVWHLELHGSGPYAVTAHVDPGPDGIELINVDFVEPGGRPGHEGMFPITRAVRSGEKLTCRVNLSGNTKNARLMFVDREGKQLDSVNLDDEYVPCVVPSGAYRAGVTGTDARGRTFARVMSPLRTPLR